MTDAPAEAQAEVPVTFNIYWPHDAAAGARVVSHFAVMGDGTQDGGLYLLMGEVAPPPWFTDEARRRGLQEVGTDLHVQVRSAVYMTRARAEELYGLLRKHLDKGVEGA